MRAILNDFIQGIKSFAAGILVVFFFSCEQVLTEETLIYSNDFSNSDLSNIQEGRLHVFNGDTVMGYFHNEEIKLTLPNLPTHNTIQVTVELLVHDSWDGNPDNVGGPDFWYMQLDGIEVLRTTFSNSPCESLFCLYQSYPDNFPRLNEPKSGALETDLPGRCQYEGQLGWTTKYRISKYISHSSSSIEIVCGDELKQENASDPVCDESWSVAKIEVTTMTLK
ncbi:hypothetical protein [Pleomorphovibrio marinus]|uniref:hypothetical protein n=1 Tax=Pleomorphovibrio marinus TaxID=2164132 RepID=UPI000E0C8A6B|nr:hypothetical protein [Pleomorphovibrio marinus]